MPSRHSTHWWGKSQELRSRVSGKSHTLRRAYTKRVKLLTFNQEGISNRWSTNRKIAELKCSRDLMGRLLVLVTRRHLDLMSCIHAPFDSSATLTVLLWWDDGQDREDCLLPSLGKYKVKSSFPSFPTYGRLPLTGSPQQSSFKQRRCQANVSTLSSTYTKCHQSKGWNVNEEVRAIGTTRA